MRKPLMWEHLKTQPRFKKYESKLVHFVLDDFDKTQLDLKGDQGLFAAETFQETLRFEMVMKWNQNTKFFADDDFVSFGDVDEIPLRSTLQYLKHCEVADLKQPIDIGSWMVEQHLHRSFRSDFPVRGHPFSYGDPTFHSFASVNQGKFLNRNRGKSQHFMLGGMHLSSYWYAPYMMTKLISCTECRGVSIDKIDENYENFLFSATKYLKEPHLVARAKDARGSLGTLEQYPWLFMCNPQRFKPVFGKTDDRLYLTRNQVSFDCSLQK